MLSRQPPDLKLNRGSSSALFRAVCEDGEHGHDYMPMPPRYTQSKTALGEFREFSPAFEIACKLGGESFALHEKLMDEMRVA